MKEINYLVMFLLSSFIISSCGGPNSPEGGIDQPDSIVDGKEMISYEELVLDFESTLNGLPGSALVVETSPESFAFQPIVIRNNKRVGLPVSVNLSSLDGLSGVEVVNNCPAVLKRKRYCYISLFVNRNEDMGESNTLAETNLTLNLDGSDFNLPVQAQTTAALDLDALAEDKLHVSSTLLDYGSVAESGKRPTKILIIKNNSVRKSLPLNKDLSALSIANQALSTCPADGVEMKRRGACFIALELNEALAVNTYSESITVAGKSISLDVDITADVIPTSNNLVDYIKDPVLDFSSSYKSSVIEIDNNTNADQDLYYNFYPVEKSEGISGLDYPEAFSLQDGCSNKDLLRNSRCYIQMSFDPERYHFGVIFSKTVSFNDEDMELSFEGSSPCSDPGHAMYQPGTKLSPDKKSCVPNLGVFDSPDSVYGHAVYQ